MPYLQRVGRATLELAKRKFLGHVDLRSRRSTNRQTPRSIVANSSVIDAADRRSRLGFRKLETAARGSVDQRRRSGIDGAR